MSSLTNSGSFFPQSRNSPLRSTTPRGHLAIGESWQRIHMFTDDGIVGKHMDALPTLSHREVASGVVLRSGLFLDWGKKLPLLVRLDKLPPQQCFLVKQGEDTSDQLTISKYLLGSCHGARLVGP